MNVPHSVTASVLVLILYLFAGVAVRQRWNHRIALNPLKIVAGVSGRASLSNAQVFFFTLIVAWLALYWVIREGELIPINDTVLALLGIAVVGSAAGKATAISRFRVTGQNWAWSKKKGWIKESFNRSAVGQTPKPSDLITSDQGFEIAKFQAVIFSLIVGISLLVTGATATSPGAFSGFEVKEAYLALIGLSQVVYVGGKAIGSNLIAELNKKLDDVRKLETEFTSAVANSATWKGLAKADRTMKVASEQAKPTEYVAYMSAATEAAEIVRHVTGIPVAASRVEPELPVTL